MCEKNVCQCNSVCHHEHESGSVMKAFLAPVVSFAMLIAGIAMSHAGAFLFPFESYVELSWYILAFLPVGLPVLKEAAEAMGDGDVFNEFTLMSIACIGAFFIGEYPEAVGVMLFYSIGETLQDKAVDRARHNISRLLDMRGDKAHIVRSGNISDMDPRSVEIGETIEVRPGERVPLDGVLQSGNGIFDTSGLTGESVPREIACGGEVLAGMISCSSAIRIRVTKAFGQSTLARILELVENAAGRKAQTELFIRRFARVYTPVVLGLAALLVLVPWIIGMASPNFHYVFSEWLYRALVFLVISCPCALVISVPLGYYAGIGAASKAGILFKGGSFLEAIRKIDTVALDKTGTVTTGKFHVEKIINATVSREELMALMASAEMKSSHPLAVALVEHTIREGVTIPAAVQMREIAGLGAVATVEDHDVVVGSLNLLRQEGILCPEEFDSPEGTFIACGIDGRFAGCAVMADTLKADAEKAVKMLREEGVRHVVMLSGDRKETVERYASKIGIDEAYGECLPQDKAEFVEKLAGTPDRKIAFVGDGMNDAPVLALSDVGIAMGGLGSDAAIESADIVVQTDSPSKVATAIRIGRTTHTIVMENIIGAIGIKSAVLILGAFGFASLWGAVFADVGVALLAVLNSMRIFRKKF